MKGECRNEADHALGETLGRLGKAMVSIELRIRKLIEPARQADDLAILFHAADGCGGHAGGPEFCKAQNPARREEIAGYFALGPGLRHRYILSHFNIHSARDRKSTRLNSSH